jgi:hypothetical protein
MPGMETGCCSASFCGGCLSRRGFLARTGAAGLAVPAAVAAAPQAPGALRVQPVFVHQIKTRREATSWRFSAEIHTEEEAAQERARIQQDLAAMKARAEFPLEVLPLATVHEAAEAPRVTAGAHDVLLMYAAGRDRAAMDALALPDKWNLVFVRHRSGRIYYMYIGVHPHFLRKTRDEFGQPGMDVEDVVVDSHDDLLWRLRALYGLKNTLGKRVVAIGAPGGWGADGAKAPERARARWKLDLRTVTYPELEARLKKAAGEAALIQRAQAAAARYLAGGGVRLETSKEFFERAFVLTEVFRQILAEQGTDAITINQCMSTIMPISRTTACLPLSILNDEGGLAFCESDFVVIPAGILLHYISGQPVFLCNASFPYAGVVTVSHCTAPRRMDGRNLEPVRVLTHYESDYGAAPKVEMRKGQTLTVLNPDFAGRRWLGFRGEIENTPFYPICRTQLEVAIKGDQNQLRRELRGFHWMLCYGDYLREVGYALKKAGVDWLAV